MDDKIGRLCSLAVLLPLLAKIYYPMININKKITAIRNLRRLSQADAADRSHIAFRTYQRIESGATSPKVGHLEDLAKAFKCTVADILHFDMEKNCFPPLNEQEVLLQQKCTELETEVGRLRQLVAFLCDLLPDFLKSGGRGKKQLT